MGSINIVLGMEVVDVVSGCFLVLMISVFVFYYF